LQQDSALEKAQAHLQQAEAQGEQLQAARVLALLEGSVVALEKALEQWLVSVGRSVKQVELQQVPMFQAGFAQPRNRALAEVRPTATHVARSRGQGRSFRLAQVSANLNAQLFRDVSTGTAREKQQAGLDRLNPARPAIANYS
jgi:hypothetical protein